MKSLFPTTRDLAYQLLNDSTEMPKKVMLRAHETKTLETLLEEAIGKLGLSAFVMTPVPREAIVDDTVFFKRTELRVRLVENPLLNETGTDIYQLIEIVIKILHGWWPPGASTPLRLASGPIDEEETPSLRIIDVIFVYATHLLITTP